MKKYLFGCMIVAAAATLFSCKKDKTSISVPAYQVGATVSDSTPLKGSVKGTMLAGKTYQIGGNVVVNAGDTLFLQEGVKVCVTGNYSITVRGVLLSLGTKDKQNYFTVCSKTRNDAPGQDPSTDPAFAGDWGGIQGDTTCTFMGFKWTHIEYVGATITTPPVSGLATGDPAYGIFFQNLNGTFVFEDSYIYGTTDDAIRVLQGKFAVLRSTFEKCGKIGGDCTNVKSGGVGDIAYNLYVGDATNGSKNSNKGGAPIQANVNIYNNTYVNCGYRQLKTGRGGCINYEEGSKGMAYNNLVVNCKFGPRVVGAPVADTANLFMGNNFKYADVDSVANQFYPVGYITKPVPTDIPAPASFLPANYTLGMVYNGHSVVGQNNPMFVNFTLPEPAAFTALNYAGGFDFHLKAGSPAIGKGTTTALKPLAMVPVSSKFGVTEMTPPGADCGAFQSSGSGNQH